MQFEPIASAPEDVEVETMVCDEHGPRNLAILVRSGRLWFLTDGSMYVYYEPTHWRYPERVNGPF